MALGDVVYSAKKGAKKAAGKAGSALRKARPFLIAILLIIILVPVIIIIIVNVRRSQAAALAQHEAEIKTQFTGLSIPKENLYLPEEPDFMQQIMLTPKKKTWTPEDAAPYWKAPSEIGEDAMRDKVTQSVDSLMQNVP
jgi:hypothetical protein